MARARAAANIPTQIATEVRTTWAKRFRGCVMGYLF